VLKIAKEKLNLQRINSICWPCCKSAEFQYANQRRRKDRTVASWLEPINHAGFNQCEQNICKHRCNHLLGFFNKPSCDHVVDIIVLDPDSLIRIRIQVYCWNLVRNQEESGFGSRRRFLSQNFNKFTNWKLYVIKCGSGSRIKVIRIRYPIAKFIR
jgi:hypothetical protein